jgi:hypothetical protein
MTKTTELKTVCNDYVIFNFPATIVRAVNVARAANKPLVVITGEKELFAEYEKNEKSKFKIKTIKPCKCGWFGNQQRRCNCEAPQIRSYWHKITLASNAVYAELQGSLWRHFQFKNINEMALMILKNAYLELGLSGSDLIATVEIAAAIARMESKREVLAEHMAEAISYRRRQQD